MKRLRKAMAAIIAATMTVSTMGTMPAFAAEGAPADKSISVSKLEAGDTVNFYKVLKFDETAKDTGGWVAAEGFTSLTPGEINQILGRNEEPEKNGISAELAGKISQMAQADDVTPRFANVEASDEGVATQATTVVGDAGLYVALVTPGNTDTLYNPVFVGADYNDGNGSNTEEAATTLSYEPEALAKKEEVILTKEVDGTGDTKYDVNVGDDVSFTITSKVPAFSTAYQNPVYVISDEMEEGLVLKALPTVTIAGITLAEADYTIDPSPIAADTRAFTVTLNKSGLDKVAAKGSAQEITVTYTATVKSLEDFTVSEKENEATVKFSNNPDDSTSYSLLEDKTRHYTFTIDGNLLGYTGTSYETDELIKIGLNADGSDATETQKYHSGEEFTELSPLRGAKFAIFKSAPEAADYANEAAAKASSKIYTNATETDGIIESDANGRLKIQGLDEGKYYLHEVSAPTGYIADNRTFEITISATYTQIDGGVYTNDDGIKVRYDAYKVLDGYTVTVNDGTNNNTSTYNIVNRGEVDHKVVDKATYKEITGEHFAGDSVTPISNTKGTELPSTGGIGTTVFYVVGGGMVVGAVVFLLTKRRVSGNE